MFLMTVLAASFTFSTSAQKKDDPKHTNYYKDVEEPVETKEVVIEFTNGVSRFDFLKFKAKFTNNTNDFLIVDPAKFKIKTDGVTHQPKEKAFILDPNDSKAKTIDVKEGENFKAEEFEVSVDGFALIPVDGKPTQMSEFQLPASTNNMKSGNFEVNLKRVSQETKETWAVFSIKYTGDGYGIVDPSRISIKTESGEQFANEFRKSKTILLEKGETKSVDAVFHIPAKVVDMQFAKLFIQWGECMVETEAVALELDESVTFTLDEALTAEKNK
jgi:hypothetical protein